MLLQAEKIASKETLEQIQGYIDNMYPFSFRTLTKEEKLDLARGEVIYVQDMYIVWDFNRKILTDAHGYYFN